MTDSQRLDALFGYGLMVMERSVMDMDGRCISCWECCYGIDRQVTAPTIREVIDKAVADMQEVSE